MATALTSVGAVERALRAARRDALGASPVVGTQLFDVVVWCETPASARESLAALREMRTHRPSRAIVVQTGRFDAVEAQVHVVVMEPPDGHGPVKLGADVVMLKGPRDGGALAQMATSLLLTDLPTILIWRGRSVVDSPAFGVLTAAINRLVTDSMLHPELFDETRALPVEKAIGDLAWTAITPVRAQVAAAFDGHDAGRLALAETVEIGHDPDYATSARLLCGWLSCYARSAEIALAAVAADTGQAIHSVEFGWGGTRPRRLPIDLTGLERPSLASLFAEEFDRYGLDQVFVDAHRATAPSGEHW